MKTIRIDIADKSSVESAIKELEAVKREWKRKTEEVEEKVASLLAERIGDLMTQIPSTDDVIDLETHQEIPGFPMFGVYSKGNTVYIEGDEVVFVEFGAGVYHAGVGNPLADSVHFHTEIGSYGKGQGLKPYWFIEHNVISRGTPAYMPIWLAIQDIKPMIPTIVRQVFV